MIKPIFSVKKTSNIDLQKSLKALEQKYVVIGIQEKDSSRQGEPVNNAELAFLHTEGSPAQHIPARPFLQPSVMADKEVIADRLKMIVDASLSGEATVVIQKMTQLGIIASRNAQNWFLDPRNGWAANSPITIYRKSKKDKNGNITQISDQPLIDTGDLRRSITYGVIDK